MKTSARFATMPSSSVTPQPETAFPPRPNEAPTCSQYRPDETATADPNRQTTSRQLPNLPPRFRLVKELGMGGMGQVFEVVDDQLGATYALKVTLQRKLSPFALDRFRQEARAMVELNHPHIVRFFAYGEHDEAPYFTMRHLRGGTLAAKCPELQADSRQLVALMLKVISAIAYLHSRGMVHRDLKPHNILLDETGEPYVSDFGLVKSVSSSADTQVIALVTTQPEAPPDSNKILDQREWLTAAGSVLGTRGYMSPEQAAGDLEHLGPKTDIWALGVILYDTLVGMRPFQHPNLDELTRRIQTESPPAPSAILKSFDLNLERIILKCLEKKPEDRPSAGELHEQLSNWLNPAPVKVHSGWGRRNLTPLVAASLLAAIAVFWIFRPKIVEPIPVPPGPTIEEVRQELRKRLAAGETVALVDDRGKLLVPLTYHINGDHARAIAIGEDCTVDCSSLTYAELLDDVGIANYRFRVQVKCDRAASRPSGGLYFAHRVFDSTDFSTHFMGEVRFVDPLVPVPRKPLPAVGKDADAGPSTFKQNVDTEQKAIEGSREVLLRRIAVPKSEVKNALTARAQYDPKDRKIPATENQVSVWRSLSVEASPTEFKIVWNGETISSISRPVNNVRRELLLKGLRQVIDKEAIFATSGGIGLIISSGAVSFRSAEVQLLDQRD